MKKILGLIVIILLFAYIPIYSIWPIDYSSKTANILILLVNAQVIIIESLSSLISLLMPILLGLVDTIAGLLFQVIGAILSLPYGDINPAYVLIGLFITAYFFEKFRVINNEISKLNKKLLKHITSNQNDSKKPLSDHMDEIYKLNNKANSIMSLLLEINNATNIFKSIGLRSKKMRRESALESSTNHNEEVVSFSDLDKSNDISRAVRDEKRAKDEEQLMRLRKDTKSLAEEDKDSDELNTVDEIMDDEISQAVRDEKRAKDEEQLMRLRKDTKSLAEEDKDSDELNTVDEISQAVRDEKRAKDEEQLMRLRKDAKSLAEEDKDSDEVNTVDEIMDDETSQAVRDEKRAKDEEQLMRLRKDAKSLAEEDKDSDEVNTVDEIMDDDNISQIDLARALIASNDVDNARDLLKRIVETGSEDDKHEARLLFMQIK